MHTLKPIPYNFGKRLLHCNFTDHYNVPDIYTNEQFSKAMQVMVAGEDIVGSPEIPTKPPLVISYFGLLTQINHCVNNAEKVNDSLRKFLVTLSGKPTNECGEILSNDFMQNRDIFSAFIKGFQPLKGIDEYNTTKKIKNVTSALFNFIIDRNIYTHGQLKLLSPENIFLIEFIQKSKYEYVQITPEILSSYNSIYPKLLGFINTVEQLFWKEKNNLTA